MKLRYRIKDRLENPVTSEAEKFISADIWRYTICDHDSPSVFGKGVALVLKREFAELIIDALNEKDLVTKC